MKTPTPALAVSLVALAVALGGTGYAVTQLPKNSVGTAQLKKDAVTGAKVKAGSLEASDFKKGSLPAGAQGPAGPQGAAGPAGATGATGATGPQGPSEVAYASSEPEVTVSLDTTVIQLSTNGAVLTTSGTRLVLVEATIQFRRAFADRATPARIGCTFASAPLGEALVRFQGGATPAIMPAMPNATFNTVDSITIVDSIQRGAGTWDFGVICSGGLGDPSVTVPAAKLNVIAGTPPPA